jgi:hypothetical protein
MSRLLLGTVQGKLIWSLDACLRLAKAPKPASGSTPKFETAYRRASFFDLLLLKVGRNVVSKLIPLILTTIILSNHGNKRAAAKTN